MIIFFRKSHCQHHHNEYDDLPPLVEEIDVDDDSEYDDLPPLVDDENVYEERINANGF